MIKKLFLYVNLNDRVKQSEGQGKKVKLVTLFGFADELPLFNKSSETNKNLTTDSIALCQGLTVHILLQVKLAYRQFPPIAIAYLDGVLRRHSMST